MFVGLCQRVFVGLWIHQKSIWTNSSWCELTKKLDADSEEIQPPKFAVQLKNARDSIVDAESMLALKILEKTEQKILKFSEGSVTVLYKKAKEGKLWKRKS